MSVVFGEETRMTRTSTSVLRPTARSSASTSASSPTRECTGETSKAVQHELKSNLTYQHNEKYSPAVPRALASIFRSCYDDFIHGREISDEDYRILSSFRVSEEGFFRLVVKPELPGSQGIYLEDNQIIFRKISNEPHGQVIIEITNQICAQDRAAGEFLLCGTGNRTTIFQAFTDRRYSPRAK
jgi:hypothetical protein